MVILNDERIREYVECGRISVFPRPSDVQFQPASLDLRLDDLKFVFDTSSGCVFDTRSGLGVRGGGCLERFSEEDPLVLEPGEFVLTQTLERVCLPDDLVARVEGRSSIGRLGVVVHVTAGFVDPGFCGRITLEMVNLGGVPVVLYPGMRVCQLVFEELNAPAVEPYSGVRNKYQHQDYPTPSRIIFDDE